MSFQSSMPASLNQQFGSYDSGVPGPHTSHLMNPNTSSMMTNSQGLHGNAMNVIGYQPKTGKGPECSGTNQQYDGLMNMLNSDRSSTNPSAGGPAELTNHPKPQLDPLMIIGQRRRRRRKQVTNEDLSPEEEAKRENLRMRNRIAAAKCRNKMVHREMALEKEIHCQEQQMKATKKEIAQLQAMKSHYSKMLTNHHCIAAPMMSQNTAYQTTSQYGYNQYAGNSTQFGQPGNDTGPMTGMSSMNTGAMATNQTFQGGQGGDQFNSYGYGTPQTKSYYPYSSGMNNFPAAGVSSGYPQGSSLHSYPNPTNSYYPAPSYQN